MKLFPRKVEDRKEHEAIERRLDSQAEMIDNMKKRVEILELELGIFTGTRRRLREVNGE